MLICVEILYFLVLFLYEYLKFKFEEISCVVCMYFPAYNFEMTNIVAVGRGAVLCIMEEYWIVVPLHVPVSCAGIYSNSVISIFFNSVVNTILHDLFNNIF